MKKILILHLLCFMYWVPTIYGQECGTKFTQEDMDFWNQASSNGSSNPAAKMTGEVPIQVHILCDGDDCAYTNAEIDLAISTLNDYYSPVGMEFVECAARNLIDDPDYYFWPDDTQLDRIMTHDHNVGNVINIYFSYRNLDFSAGFTYGSPSSPDLIVIAKTTFSGDVIGSKELVLVHEMAHYFGVAHTHGIGSAGFTNELVDGSNANDAGDYIADTPADPAKAAYFNNDVTGEICHYPWIGGGVFPCPGFCDANEDIYTPLSDNLMFFKHCPYGTFNQLTSGQLEKAYEGWQTGRAYLGKGDVYMKDCWSDGGEEPNNVCDMPEGWQNIWASPDLWNCASDPNCTTHENPDHLTEPNTLRIRVRNRGCYDVPPAQLHLYWTFAQTGESWPESWEYDPVNNVGGVDDCVAGEEITSYPNWENDISLAPIDIPAIPAGGSTIINYEWMPPDPNCFELVLDKEVINGTPMLCFLARIVSDEDEMFFELNLDNGVGDNVARNNSIVARNAYFITYEGPEGLVDDEGDDDIGIISDGAGLELSTVCVAVANNNAQAEAVSVSFSEILNRQGTDFNELGQITVYLENYLWRQVMSGNAILRGMEVRGGGGLRITNPANAQIQNLRLAAIASHDMCFRFGFRKDLHQNPRLFGSNNELNFAFKIDHTIRSGRANPSSANIVSVKVKAPKRPIKSLIHSLGKMDNLSTLEKQVKISPNPTKGNVEFSFVNGKDLIQQIEIYSLTGQLMQTKVVEDEQKVVNMDVSDLDAGVYMVRMVGVETDIVSKLIILK